MGASGMGLKFIRLTPASGRLSMKSLPFFKIAVLALSTLFLFAGVSSTQVLNHNEVEFTATIQTIYPDSGDAGTIDVSVSGATLSVIVSAETDIMSGENEITLSDLSADDVIKVEGKFSSEGVLASSIEKVTSDAENGFEFRGVITDIQVTDNSVLISIAGITVTADKSMKTSGRPSTAVDVASLTVGTAVSIEGTISGDTWNATSIHVFSDKGKQKDVVRFEGTIVEMSEGGLISVQVEGTETVQPVIVGPDTKTCGTLAVGAVVEVKGKLNADLQVEADVVCVIGALEIKPDHLKLKVGATEMLTVKLRETASSDVTVSLTVDGNVITLSTDTLTIPQGSKIATFSVTAGQDPGEATITATANGQTATALVVVGLVSDSDNQHPDAAVRIVFSPDHVRMGAGETREVVLLVQPPQVQLNQTGVDLQVSGDVSSAQISRDLSGGTARYKVVVTSKTNPEGTGGSVLATLPGVEGSGTAELVVVITSKGK
jgi:hypothetical protein